MYSEYLGGDFSSVVYLVTWILIFNYHHKLFILLLFSNLVFQRYTTRFEEPFKIKKLQFKLIDY